MQPEPEEVKQVKWKKKLVFPTIVCRVRDPLTQKKGDKEGILVKIDGHSYTLQEAIEA